MKKNFKTLIFLAMPYVITIILPILSTLFLSRVVANRFQEEMVVEKQKSIESAFDRSIKKIEGIERLMYAVAKNDAIAQYINFSRKGEYSYTAQYLKVKDMFGSLMIDSNVTAIYYYDINNDRIITNDASYATAETYFRYRYQIENFSIEDFVERIENLPRALEYSESMAVKLDSASMNVIECRMPMPIDVTRKPSGQLTMIINVEALFSDVIEVLDEGGEFYVYDSHDRLIYGNGYKYNNKLGYQDLSNLHQIDLSEADIWGMSYVADDSNWKTDVYIPELFKNVDTKHAYIYSVVYGIVPTLISIFLCMYFTVKNYREIFEIINMFRKHGNIYNNDIKEIKKVDYRYIQQLVNMLMSENNQFREQIDTFEQSYKYEVLDKLIRNTYSDKEKDIEALNKLNLNITTGRCIVLCIRYKNTDYRAMLLDNMSVKDFVKELLYKHIERAVEIFDTTAKETICILALNENDDVEAVIHNIISIINVEIVYAYGIELGIVAGNAVNSIISIGESYAQAKEVISYNETFGAAICMYSELEQMEDIYYYPAVYDEKICNYIMAGKAEEAKTLVYSVYKENFVDNSKKLSAKAIEIIKQRLEKSIILLAEKNDISMNEVRKRVKIEQNVDDYFALLLDIIPEICDELSLQRQYSQNQSALKIMNFIKENYSDSSLSLKYISTTLGFNEHYISDLFKSTYGEKFSTFVEKMRIEKSCELLKGSEMKLHDIALGVGYTSDVSFRRAFKKVMGITPSEYKDF